MKGGPLRSYCAAPIYTRKNRTEHNLDLALSTRSAHQREACEAHIKSQAHEGLGDCCPDHYDDGGGLHLDKEKLQSRTIEGRRHDRRSNAVQARLKGKGGHPQGSPGSPIARHFLMGSLYDDRGKQDEPEARANKKGQLRYRYYCPSQALLQKPAKGGGSGRHRSDRGCQVNRRSRHRCGFRASDWRCRSAGRSPGPRRPPSTEISDRDLVAACMSDPAFLTTCDFDQDNDPGRRPVTPALRHRGRLWRSAAEQAFLKPAAIRLFSLAKDPTAARRPVFVAQGTPSMD